jgi:hypothetical protein
VRITGKLAHIASAVFAFERPDGHEQRRRPAELALDAREQGQSGVASSCLARLMRAGTRRIPRSSCGTCRAGGGQRQALRHQL